MYKELFMAVVGRQTVSEISDSALTRIGPYAFAHWCTNYGATVNLVKASFPNVTRIEQYAFSNCIRLSEVNVPNAEWIGPFAFSSCEVLAILYLPKITQINGRLTFNCFNMSRLEIPLVTNFGTDSYFLQNIGSRRSGSDTDEYGNVYKTLVDVSANTCSSILSNSRFPWGSPTTTKFLCSDGYIIYDSSTSAWKAVTT